MNTAVVHEPRPVNKMAPKTGAEVFNYSPETDEFPEGSYFPRKNLCLIAPIKAQEKTAGGIILPGQAREAEQYLQSYGRVVVAGPHFYKLGALKDDPEPIAVGDFVHFEPYAAKRIEIDGKTFYMIKDLDIHSRIDPKQFSYKVYA